ncbi:UvrD-helicase domain-containing protein [Mycolicibacterium mucogenicum]|uniref:UvrD-helicase domain-containing protein n=1 Tax=Mycolicibacterium mucogenicum TaxID=56689 RepID=UPI00226AE611|nr:UvrD-helicase domain-containing protein [Mycolicibacterium mucogenicum]MCX8565173.1 UvrD-helicase domain-containing protein [Mycolicibacterium mucogenicum]
MPQPNSRLTLAVAGSRKTQGLVEACKQADPTERILVLTYTRSNQTELATRLAASAGDHPHVDVAGWFSFLLHHFVGPFLPLLYPGARVEGFDFGSPPQRYAANDQWQRYFNEHSEARRVHLPQLAVRTNEASAGVCIQRLERIYDRIMIDEVQDLSGYDLEILKLLIASGITVEMVGDVRQAIMATNEREPKNKKYMFMNIWNWFREQEKARRLIIEQRRETWRCAPEIAAFADSLFAAHWNFSPTESRNVERTGHDGMFLVAPQHVDAYCDEYHPLLLRHSRASGKKYAHLDPMNIGDAKGLERQRVLVYPTGVVEKFLTEAASLDDKQAARLYVAVTRARYSAAFIMNPIEGSSIPVWVPAGDVTGD